MSKTQWYFPNNGGGLAAGFNDSGIDTFKGQRLSALVREIVQNSLDASIDKDQPVTVNFSIISIDKKEAPEVSSLEEHLSLAKETAKKQDLDFAVDFYDAAIKMIKEDEKINFLCIHDSNTTGLTGPVTGPNGAWFALTKGAGLSQKTSTSSLGSFGHGSKAPFANSNVRSLFYLTKIKQDSGHKYRFQGKSILQSHAKSATEMSQGTGFYGKLEGCLPLENDEIPKWAIRTREEFSKNTGTSIFVPHTIFNLGSYKSIAITAIANFFYAIKKGYLIVQVGDFETLTSENIEEKYHYYKNELDKTFDEVDNEYISECFKAIETIVNCTDKGEQQISKFGRIDWYIRMGEDVDTRSVAIARENGMLITRSAPSLQRFQNLKPFDFFVCVTGEGSETLKNIENPEHNNFAFDRIDNLAKRRDAKRKYEIFASSVRELLKRFAQYTSDDRVTVDELEDLFSEISENPEEGKGHTERGATIQIADGSYGFKPRPPSDSSLPGDGNPDDLKGRGQRGGERKKRKEGGEKPDKDGKTKIIGPSKPASGSKPKNYMKLENIRMRAKNDSEAYIYFDAPITGNVSISFKKSGEVGNEALNLTLDGKTVNAVDVKLVKGERECVLVKFSERKIDFSVEAEAYEIDN